MSAIIYHSCVVNSQMEKVWAILGNFNDLTWINKNISCTIESPEFGYNPVRSFKIHDGRTIKENLLSFSINENYCFFEYDFEKGFELFNVDNYRSTVSVRRITSTQQTLISAQVTFNLRKDHESEKEKIDLMFKNRIGSLSELFIN